MSLHPAKTPTPAPLSIVRVAVLAISFTLLAGCATSQKLPSPTAITPTPGINSGNPYGVYDIQSGHGHGQWKKSPKSLVR